MSKKALDISKYELRGRLGEGSFGKVYRAVVKTTGEAVALKVLKYDLENEGLPVSALREVSLVKELRHSHVVRLIDVLFLDRRLVIVSEFCECGDLRKYIDNHRGRMAAGGLDGKTVRSFTAQLLDGVRFCHSRNVVHRDLKPQNIFITKKLEVKIGDFGLARSFALPVRRQTQEAVTLWYRDPELLLGGTNHFPPIDVWSVGCILAEMCSGQVLFQAKSTLHDTKQESEEKMLDVIFKLLGPITEEAWPAVVHLPDWAATQQRIIRFADSFYSLNFAFSGAASSSSSSSSSSTGASSSIATTTIQPATTGAGGSIASAPSTTTVDNNNSNNSNNVNDVNQALANAAMSNTIAKLHEKLPSCDPQCIDLLSKMLRYDPMQRVTAEQALRHPYFESLS